MAQSQIYSHPKVNMRFFATFSPQSGAFWVILADIMVLPLGSDRSPWIEYGFEHPAPKLVKTHANKYAIVFTRLA